MNLEDQVGARFDQFGFSRLKDLWRHSWHIDIEKLVIGRAANPPVLLGDEGLAGLCFDHVLGSGRAYEDQCVVDHSAVAWPQFRDAHPLVLLKSGGQNEMLIRYGPRGGYVKLLRHLKHQIRLARAPAFGKLERS